MLSSVQIMKSHLLYNIKNDACEGVTVHPIDMIGDMIFAVHSEFFGTVS